MFNNYISYFKRGKKVEDDSGVRDSLKESSSFYDSDVKPRRKRERGLDTQEFADSVYVGFEDPESFKDTYGVYDVESDEISISPELASKAEKLLAARELLARIVSHEGAHRDTAATEEDLNITESEKKFLNKAYKGESEDSESIEEKHAFNRELRHGVYLLFIKKNKREPESIEELDKFIKSDLKDSEIKKLMKSGSAQGLEYLKSIKKKKASINSVKKSLIHVASIEEELSENVTRAHFGGVINYLKLMQ